MLNAAEFLAKFPDFAEVNPGVIQRIVAEANAEVPADWSEHDLAAGYFAAHLMAAQGYGASAAAAGMHAASSGTKMMKVGDVAVSYGTHAADAPSSSLAGRYGSTVYGQRYLEIARRNTPAIEVIF